MAQAVLRQHPLSACFPAMPAEDLAALTEDIRTNGQREAGIVLDGQVLDGWNRYLACQRAGKKFATIPFPGGDPVAFALSRNLHRRHLTGSQRAASIVAATSWRKDGAESRGGGEAASPPPTVEAMAKAAEVSPRTIQQAKVAHEAGLGQKVAEGKVSAEKAAAVAKLPAKQREAAVAAIERGEDPLPAKKGPAPSSNEKLEIELADLKERLAEAIDEVKRLSATRAGDMDVEKLIADLQSELRTTKAKRDNLMRENAELKKQLRFAEKKAKH